jgi:hypothetical protein
LRITLIALIVSTLSADLATLRCYCDEKGW